MLCPLNFCNVIFNSIVCKARLRQAACRVSPLSVATSHPLNENVPMLCHSTANHLSVLNQVGIESIDSFASVTNAQPSGV